MNGLIILLCLLTLALSLWMLIVSWMLSKVWCWYCDGPDAWPEEDPTEGEGDDP